MPRLEDHWYNGMAWEEAEESAEKIGVEVWPNVSTTRDDLSLLQLIIIYL